MMFMQNRIFWLIYLILVVGVLFFWSVKKQVMPWNNYVHKLYSLVMGLRF